MDGWMVQVSGTPAPQGSKRHVGNGIMVESSKRVKPYRDAIAAACAAVERFERNTPVVLTVIFCFQRPKHHYGTGRNAGVLRKAAPTYHTQRPDVDKLVRSVMDALTQSGVLWDDAQVVDLSAVKLWSDSAESYTTIGLWVKSDGNASDE